MAKWQEQLGMLVLGVGDLALAAVKAVEREEPGHLLPLL